MTSGDYALNPMALLHKAGIIEIFRLKLKVGNVTPSQVRNDNFRAIGTELSSLLKEL